MKPFAEKFYNSKAWRECRKAFFQIKHGICDRCGEPGKIVHHTEYLTPENIHDPFISLNFEKLELHCQECHNKEHHSLHDIVREDVMFDENGDLVRSGYDEKV